jgi:DedD protein
MDDGLKQRLIGAIVLVAIAVLLLPGLLDRDAQRTIDLTSQIPPQPAVVTEIVEIAEPTPPEGIPAAKPLAENYPHQPVETPETADAVPTEESGSAPEPQPEPAGPAEAIASAPALNDEGVPDAWSLQVASFQSTERAQAMLQQLQSAGFKSYVRAASTRQGTVHRVFVGPKINRAAAEAEKRSIDERFKTNALVVEFKP